MYNGETVKCFTSKCQETVVVKMDFRHITAGLSIILVSFMPDYLSAASSKRVIPYCKKHHRPCTLKHHCFSYFENNARLFYSDGEYYNYKHNGGFYNYISSSQYYAYFDRGTFYNYFKDGKYYSTCKPQTGSWQNGKWIVPAPICK